jgi:hypothetical protein
MSGIGKFVRCDFGSDSLSSAAFWIIWDSLQTWAASEILSSTVQSAPLKGKKLTSGQSGT